jgi:hypothetical protein
MKIAGKLAWTVPLAVALAFPPGCGGKVVVEGGGDGGSGGDGGGSTTASVTFEPPGPAKDCAKIECESGISTCSCRTACMGPDLRADCELKSDGTIVCECHYDGGYMGLCAHFGGALCGLPDGCCLDYLAE